MGSWFGRLITDHTIETGSFEALVKLFTKPSRGFIIASPTVCVWSKALGRAVVSDFDPLIRNEAHNRRTGGIRSSPTKKHHRPKSQ
jgi:hypothetical protein